MRFEETWVDTFTESKWMRERRKKIDFGKKITNWVDKAHGLGTKNFGIVKKGE